MTCPDFLELQRHGLHYKDSHDKDASKTLTYDQIVGGVEVETFATRAQELPVDYLRSKYGDAVADWCRDYWTGKRDRMCLAQSRYAGSNNNVSVEVSWHLIKAI